MEMALFERFIIEMTKEQALSASHPGDCSDDVDCLLLQDSIKNQLVMIPDVSLRAELKGHGAWSYEELEDREANEARIIWLAACQIKEELEEGED